MEKQKTAARRFFVGLSILMCTFYDQHLTEIVPETHPDILDENALHQMLLKLPIDSHAKICVIPECEMSNPLPFEKIDRFVDAVIITNVRHQSFRSDNWYRWSKPWVEIVGEYTGLHGTQIHFPYWMFVCNDLAKDDTVQPDRLYKVSCINRNTRPHRVYNYVKLTELPFVHELYLTAYSTCPVTGQAMSERLHSAEYQKLPEKIIAKYRHLNANLPKNIEDDFGEASAAHNINLTGYQESKLIIVTETYEDAAFLSEKSFKPIRSEQLFLMAGPANAIAQLRSYGFDVFDDYINHQYYDSEPDWQKRFDLMHQELKRIYNDIDRIYEETFARRKKNRELLVSEQLVKDNTQALIKWVEFNTNV